jgi:hypothetical protein
VEVIKGPEAGKRGKVLEILRHVNRVRVEGVNIVSQDPHIHLTERLKHLASCPMACWAGGKSHRCIAPSS